MKRNILLLLVSLLHISHAYSQHEKKEHVHVKQNMQVVLKDTMFIVKNDTVLMLTKEQAAKIKINKNPEQKEKEFYDSLEKKVSNKKVSKNIYDLVITERDGTKKTISPILRSEDVFKEYEGYKINSIVFKAVDLLEGSVIDTLQKATTTFGKFVNKVHHDTRSRIVQRNLLFSTGDLVDPYRLADNERVLRQFITLRDARIYLSPGPEGTKYVDVIIVTQDVASIGASGSYNSPQDFRVDVYDINILGYAKQLQLSYFLNTDGSPKHGYEITYRDPNVGHTFLQGELQYTENYLRQRGRVTLGRDFFTPDIKYAGGVDLFRTRENYFFEDYDTLEAPYTENNLDVWAGRSFKIKRRMNLIFSTRVNTIKFTDRPLIENDTNTFFYNKTLFLSSVSLTERNYMKGYRILGFGKTEDIPIGGSVSFLFGKEFREFSDRVYGEVNGSYGRYFDSFGYINFNWTLGSFFNSGHGEDGLVALNAVYFSDLAKVRKTQVRQFIAATYKQGFNRILDHTISLEGKWKDEKNILPLGNKQLSLGFETVYFLPWKVIGFQFATYHNIEANFITSNKTLVSKESFFPALHIGTRVLNDNLVLPTFEIEIGYYATNPNYKAAWEIKFKSTLPDLFNTSQRFEPRIAAFN